MKRLPIFLLFILTSFSSFSQGYSGLIGRWSFNGNANDVSGNGLNGIVYGASLTTGFSGAPNTAYSFNGVDNYINVPYNALMNTPVHTICALVKPTGFYSGTCQGNFILARGHEFSDHLYQLEFFDGVDDNCDVFSPDIEVFAGGAGLASSIDPITSWAYTPPIALNTWYCVVQTYDGDTIRTYVNGILKTRFHWSGTYTDNTDSITIGKSENGDPFQYFLNGTIDEIRLYNRVLTAEEVNIFCDSAEAAVAVGCQTITMPDSMIVCLGDTATIHTSLSGGDPEVIAWSPSTGLSDTTILTPIVTGTTSMYYYLTVTGTDATNLVVNGDFSAGNTGFSSSYTYSAPPSSILYEGNYSVTTDPHNVHSGAYSYSDHTSGSGNMMVINAASTPIDVWCETITVTPNTYYDFSAWFSNWSADTTTNFPLIQFEINGTLITSSSFTFPATPGLWQQFYSTWYSGTSTSVTICIHDNQTAAFGNDFAIDDISFNAICYAKDSIYVNVTSAQFSDTTEYLSICADTATLSGPVGYNSYLWNTGSASSTLFISASGTYWRVATRGCTQLVDTFHVQLHPFPAVSLGPDTVLCGSDSIVLSSGIYSSAYTYAWNTGSSAPSIIIADPGLYWLIVYNSVCSARDTIIVTAHPYPVMHLGNDTSVCYGQTLLLHPLDTYISPSYTWSTGAHTASIGVNTPGSYSLTVDILGCKAGDTVNVSFKPVPAVNLGNDTAVCNGKAIILSSIQAPGAQYVWNTGAITSSITVAQAGTYGVIVTVNGCSASDSVNVVTGTMPSVDLGPDTTLCDGYILHLSADAQNGHYVWSVENTSPDLDINTPGIYWVVVSNACGIASDTISVNYNFCNIWIPNAFTPNGDGRNDIIHVLGSLEGYSDFAFYIVNRWGQIVFSTKDINKGWDGIFNGIPQEVGTYYYYFNYSLNGKKGMMKGDFELIR